MNWRTMQYMAGGLILSGFAVMPSHADAMPVEHLTNGDFENEPFLSGWTPTDTPSQHSPLGDGTRGVALQTGDRIEQEFTRTEGGEWVFEGLIAVTADTSANAARTSARILFNHEISGGQGAVHLRLQRAGANTQASVQVQDADNNWNTIIAAPIDYSDLSTDGETIVDPIVYRLVVRGYDYGTPEARYEVEVIDAENNVASSGEQTIWWGTNGAPDEAGESGVHRLQIIGGQNASNLTVLDDLQVQSIPEPATMGLLSLGALLMLSRTRG